jgi:hypothetical protein
LGWRLLLLLLRSSCLELLLLWSLLLELILLLPWISRVLWLLRLRLLLPESLRLSRIASELWLHWTSSKACRLRSKSTLTLKASGLSIWLLLLLLAILGLPRSGAVAAP